MCGIVGSVGVGDERLVRRMAHPIAYRGPDDEGYFAKPGVALGSRRLSIIDVDGSQQPVRNEDGSVVAVFNGEIYNYRELRATLIRKGHAFRTDGDSEVLVHLYEEYGVEGVHLLRGMFAYAIWDDRRHRLVVVRDRIGIKPLYYAPLADGLLFASEIKSLLASGLVDRRIDHEALEQYLTLQYVPGPRTLLSGVHKLPPGHRLVWEDGRMQVTRYWDLVFSEPPERISRAAAVEVFTARLEDAVRCHRVSDVPVGTLLSGGIDSSAVVALIASTGERPTTFTVGFGNAGFRDERLHAERVSRHIGTDHHAIEVDGNLADALPRIVWFQDEPIADAAAIPTYFLCRFAAGSVKVLLTGEGGDELLAGYPRYWWLSQGERLRTERALGVSATAASVVLPGRISQRLRLMTGSESLAARHVGWVGTTDAETRHRLLVDDRAGETCETVIDHLLERSGVSNPMRRLMYADMNTWLPDNILMKLDRMSMAWSVEARVPLLDHELVEFAATLPTSLLVDLWSTKPLLRAAVGSRLPLATRRRRKKAFRVPVAAWLQGPLRTLVRDVLSPASVRGRGLFDVAAVAALVEDHENGRTNQSRLLWSLLCLELWFHEIADAAPAAHH